MADFYLLLEITKEEGKYMISINVIERNKLWTEIGGEYLSLKVCLAWVWELEMCVCNSRIGRVDQFLLKHFLVTFSQR